MPPGKDPALPKRTGNEARSTSTPVHRLAACAIDAALDKKALDVTIMDMHGVSSIADYFVLCTGRSELQIRAIVEGIEERIQKEYQEKPWQREGYEHRRWVVLDYVDLVIHVFNAEKRSYYGLERLWGDAPTEQVPEDGSSGDVQLLRKAAEQET